MKFSQLKFLTDENISPKITAFLRDKGFAVIDAKEQGWQGTDDAFLLAQSLSDKCFVITHDGDFGMLVINNDEPFFGIIYLRLKDLKTENIIKILGNVIELNPDIESGTLIVIGEKKVRVRKV